MSAVPKSSGWQQKFEKFLTNEGPNELGEQRGYCPVHEDPELSKTPSASYNWSKGTFMCFGGCGGMSFSRLLNVCREEWPEDFKKESSSPDSASRRNVRSIDDAPSKRGSAQPLPDDEEIRRWVEALQKSPTMLGKMKEQRGLSEATIEKFEIGWHKDRYTIPVRDADGVLQNVRRYKINATKAADKMMNLAGHGEARLFLPWMLAEPEIIITEGELDAIIGQEHGLPTMSHTAGASVWKPQWNPLFQEKTVFICYDVDDAGVNGALKVAAGVSRYAKAVYIIRLPLPVKGSDVTNFFVDQGYTTKDFLELMEEARKSPYGNKKTAASRAEEPAKKVTLELSMSAEHKRDTLEIVATVAGKVQPPYMLPRKVHYMCDQSFRQTACNNCPMSSLGGDMVERVAREDEFLLELIDRSKDQVDMSLKRRANIPTACHVVDITRESEWNVEELIVLPSMDNRDEQTQTPITRKVYNVGEYATPVNTTSRLVGFNTTEPKGQRAVFQSWECEQTKTNIDVFQLTPELRQALKVFQPDKKQPVLKKMGDIARDLEANITKIYGRVPLHVAYDVVWHSVMDFKFKDVVLGKGWLELLVLGDTRTGKSEAALRLSDHYNAGVLKSCEGATFAGLVGGAEQAGSSWMVRWGTIPLNDRRLVVLDEVSGIADKNIMEQMSAVRSSGRAQITKIISQETSARTRLIWIGNPVDGTTLRHMNGAIEGIQKLVKNPEDIARFDMAMAVASDEVDSAIINSTKPPEVPHIYTSDLCSALVSWAWSRKVDQITWKPGTEDYVLRVAEDMGGRYVAEPPLIQIENARVKLARIAVAIAARVFSCDKTGELIVVGNEHVDAAVQLLDTLYGTERFGYLRHSQRVIRDRHRAEVNKRQARMFLIENENILYTLMQSRGDKFRPRDFEESGSMHREEAQEAVRQLGQWKMIRRMSRGYLRMEPVLVDILSELEDRFDE